MQTKQKTVNTNPLVSLSDIARSVAQSPQQPAAPEPASRASISSDVTDGWSRFCDYANQYDEMGSKSHGVTVWIDEDVKAALEKIKAKACNLPLRHLVSAAVRTFIDQNKEDIQKAITQSKDSIL